MNSFLLDVAIGDPTTAGYYDGIWVLLVILLAVILIEAVVMLLFKLNRFGKSFLHSLIVNVASALIGYLLISQVLIFNESISAVIQWLTYFGLTVLIEGVILMLLNPKSSKGKTWLVTIMMNLASYLFLYLISSIG